MTSPDEETRTVSVRDMAIEQRSAINSEQTPCFVALRLFFVFCFELEEGIRGGAPCFSWPWSLVALGGFGILLVLSRVGRELLKSSLPRMGGADPALGGMILAILPLPGEKKHYSLNSGKF